MKYFTIFVLGMVQGAIVLDWYKSKQETKVSRDELKKIVLGRKK